MIRRKLLGAIVLACAAAPAIGQVDPYPVRPVKLFVGFVPGGATDQLARMYASKLTERLGQPVIVENRPGGGGNIAVQQLTQAAPDGYTLAMAANYVAINAALKRNPYDWERDLAPVALVAGTPNLLVVPANSRFRSPADIAEAARKPNANLTFGSPGVGSSMHMSGELFRQAANAPNVTHVAYKGVTQAEVDLVAGTIDFMFGNIATAVPLVESGRLRALAVMGAQRAKALPNVPTMGELGMTTFDLEVTKFMVVAPAKTPPQIVQRLNAAINEITRLPDVQRGIEGLYGFPLGGSASDATAFLKAEERKWAEIIRVNGIKLE